MPLGSSSLPLGALVLKEVGVKDINKDVNINIDNFKRFLIVQKNLSDATVKNHVRYSVIFLQAIGKSIDSIGIEDIQDFMLEIKKTKATETYKNYLSMLKILFRDYLGRDDLIKSFKFPQSY